MNYRSLVHASQTLEDSTARTVILLIDVDNCVTLRHIVAFDTRRLLGVLLALAHHAGVVLVRGRGSHVRAPAATSCRSPRDLIKVSLLLSHLIKTSDQVGYFGCLIVIALMVLICVAMITATGPCRQCHILLP